MIEQPHEDPETAYERMLDRHALDCSMWGCWRPIAGFARIESGIGCGRGHADEIGLCERHLRQRAGEKRWLES